MPKNLEVVQNRLLVVEDDLHWFNFYEKYITEKSPNKLVKSSDEAQEILEGRDYNRVLTGALFGRWKDVAGAAFSVGATALLACRSGLTLHKAKEMHLDTYQLPRRETREDTATTARVIINRALDPHNKIA